MSYQGFHRAPREPRWHDRPRAWLAAALHWASGTLEEDTDLTDDHGNQIGDDLPPVQWEPVCDCLMENPGPRIGGAIIGCPKHDPEPRVIRTAKVSGVHLPLSGEFVSPWVNCAFTPDVPGPVIRSADGVGLGPGYRQDVSRPGHGARRDAATPLSNGHETAGPGHLTMWDQVHVRSPWPPRPDDTIIQSGPRLCAGRIALLAGAW